MDRGAWWATVHGVAKSQTRLSDFTFTFTFHFHALEKEMATHSSVLAWRISGTGEPGGLPSVGSHRVGHDWSDLAAAATSIFFLLVLTSRFSWFCIQVIYFSLILYSIVLILGMSWPSGLYRGHYEYYILRILNSVIILQWLLFSFLFLLLVLFLCFFN